MWPHVRIMHDQKNKRNPMHDQRVQHKTNRMHTYISERAINPMHAARAAWGKPNARIIFRACYISKHVCLRLKLFCSDASLYTKSFRDRSNIYIYIYIYMSYVLHIIVIVLYMHVLMNSPISFFHGIAIQPKLYAKFTG